MKTQLHFRLVTLFILWETITTPSLISQTWVFSDGPWYVANVTNIALGYAGSTRTLYLAANGDSVLKSTGSTILWSNKQRPTPQLVSCERANGVYLYSMTTGSFSDMKKLLLVK